MPEAAMHEDDGAVPREDHVRRPRQTAGVHAEAEPRAMQEAAER